MMTPSERAVRTFRTGKLIDADQAVESVDFPGECEHQREGMFGASDIGAAAHRKDFDSARLARSDINVPKCHSIFVYDLETRRRGEFFRANAQGLGDDRCCEGEMIVQFSCGTDEPDIARKKRARRLSHSVTPPAEIRQIV